MLERIGGGGWECGVCWLNAAGKSEERRSRTGSRTREGESRAAVPVARWARGRDDTGEGFWQASRSDECLPRAPPARPQLRAAGWDAAGRVVPSHARLSLQGRPLGAGVARRGPGRRCALCAPADEEGAAGPSRAPRSRRRSPSAGCRRASLAPGRNRQPSPWPCRGEMLLRDAA